MQENKMGVMPVNRLLLTMSVPIMISMLVQALYNIVDSMFVAMLNENALTAVSLAFPAQNLMIAVSTGTGVGINALLSKSLGEKNYEKANKTAVNALFLALCSYIVFAVAGIFFSRSFFLVQTDVPEIVEGGTTYLMICTVFSFGLFFQIICERLLQATGRTIYTMISQGIGAIINIIFDPIFIFGLFGVPKMGVAGAAIATVFGQIVAAIIGIVINIKKNSEIHISLKKFRPSGTIIKNIYMVGIPSIIMASIGSVTTFGMNKILIGFSTTATAVYGVYFKLQSFVFMPLFGMNNGMVPIIAYNYGAKKPDRMVKTLKLSIAYAVGIMVIGFIVFEVFAGQLLSIFNASDYMLSIGVPALRTIAVHFLIAGFSIVSSSVFQALSHGFFSLWISLVRQLIVLLPVAFLLSLTGDLENVWWCFPVAELVSAAMCAFFLRYTFKKDIHPLQKAVQMEENR
ncbi:MAG TPA: MATE family efflux transporter [Candidatus Scybalocola faecigallinarum]|uniref:MATE family efflux transporter n=1 Tax=Candidatus Scybalocola faecigallinarum TaxID=2840941 RepID=A0A9D1F2H8_9FIRM|nr:MATE family efflux transporter [Candidatus Scybalocola faecigallinarum]